MGICSFIFSISKFKNVLTALAKRKLTSLLACLPQPVHSIDLFRGFRTPYGSLSSNILTTRLGRFDCWSLDGNHLQPLVCRTARTLSGRRVAAPLTRLGIFRTPDYHEVDEFLGNRQ